MQVGGDRAVFLAVALAVGHDLDQVQAGADVDVELLEGAVLKVAMTEWAMGDTLSRTSPVSVQANMNELGELISGTADEGGLDALIQSIPQMSLG